jgi:NADH:ubiquinone oxidoreductase subunit H
VATVPVPVLLGGWLLLNRTESPELRESLESSGLIALSVMSALSCPLLLFLTWSSKSKYVFLPGYRDTIRQTSHLRPGYSGILAAMLIVPAMFASYFALLMTLLSILALLDFIRST